MRFFVSRFYKDKKGSPALEFALIAPLFFAAVFGAMELGRGMYERNRFSAAAAIATRTLAMDSEATTSGNENGDHGEAGQLQRRGSRHYDWR